MACRKFAVESSKDGLTAVSSPRIYTTNCTHTQAMKTKQREERRQWRYGRRHVATEGAGETVEGRVLQIFHDNNLKESKHTLFTNAQMHNVCYTRRTITADGDYSPV